jgi:uncharacterized phage protein (TIGR02218 family)
MPTVPPTLALSLSEPESQVARLYWIHRRDGADFLLTDWQLPVRMQITEIPAGATPSSFYLFQPQQSPETTAITSDSSLTPSSSTFSSYVKLGGINISDIRAGLFQDSVVFIYLCDPTKSDSAVLLNSGYLAGAKNLGSEKFEMEFRSIEQRLAKNVGQTVTERCWLKLGDKRCTVPARSVVATVYSIESPNSFVFSIPPNTAWETANFWRFGSLYNIINSTIDFNDFVITTNGNIIKSTYLGNDQTLVYTMNSVEPPLIVGQQITLLEGCGCTVEDCNQRGNILNFHGFPDLPGVDKLVTSAT